jgi:hypothetical protein
LVDSGKAWSSISAGMSRSVFNFITLLKQRLFQLGVKMHAQLRLLESAQEAPPCPLKEITSELPFLLTHLFVAKVQLT